MDTIRRVFATYVGSDSPASITTSRLVPRRLSFALSSSPSSGATPVPREGEGGDDVAPRKASRLGQSSHRAGSKRARERTENEGAAGTSGRGEEDAYAVGLKRARHEESEDVVKRGGGGGGDDDDLAPWPSVKRKRDEEREDEDVEDEARPSLQRRRVSADGRAANVVRAVPALTVGKILKSGRLDAFKKLPPLPSRVGASTRLGGRATPTRRGLTLRPRHARALEKDHPVEFDELPEDKAEREKAEASRAPVLGALPSTSGPASGGFSFGGGSAGAPASAASKKKSDDKDSGSIFGAALAEFKATSSSTKTHEDNKPSSTGDDKPKDDKASAFVFGAAPASASADTPNPFATKPPSVSGTTATPAFPAPTSQSLASTATPNPFAAAAPAPSPSAGGFAFGAGSSAPAPSSGRRTYRRARRP